MNLSLIKEFLLEEDGLGTVELVLLVAVLVGIALLFRETIVEFVENVLDNISGNELDPGNI